ncbi:hypothetical protein [Kitasatospora sp. NPDC056181]|uniref:hypothetical protein n=1 Tax=Kitasatospora sp. NPDC056181 TaxID=3345737 RepID=UPI0035D55F0C
MSDGQGYYGGAGGHDGVPQPNPYAQGVPPPNPYGHGGVPQPNPYAQGVPQPNPYGHGGAPQPNPYAQPAPAPAPAPQGTPYPQPVPAQPVPAQPVPAQFVPPQPVPAQPVGGYPAPAVPQSVRAPAPPSTDYPGPAPRRSRTGVLVQFTLQWIYAPLWIAALVSLIVILLWTGASGPTGSDSWLKVNRTFIPPRRLKAELTGRPDVWERYLTPILERRIREAEARHAAGDGEVGDDLTRTMRVKFSVRLYRGLGAAGVVRLAERYGWEGGSVGGDLDRVWIRRVFPAPPRVPAPGPQDPPAAPGTPWGPRPGRFALLLPLMFVLQIVYVPVYGLLNLLAFWVTHHEPDHWERWGARWTVGPRAFWAELSGSAAAWDRHIRRILARDTRLKPGSAGPALPRRIQINLATYRGAGAQQVLRIAAEQGYVLDPAYTPEPEACVRLYRPDQG